MTTTRREEEAAGILERGLKPLPATPNHLRTLSQIRKLRSAMKRALARLREGERKKPAPIKWTSGSCGFGRRLTARARTAHEKCRDACTREMRRLRAPYPPSAGIRIDVRSLDGFVSGGPGRYEASNMHGHVWTGKACCKWRARARAAKALASRRKG